MQTRNFGSDIICRARIGQTVFDHLVQLAEESGGILSSRCGRKTAGVIYRQPVGQM